MRRILRVSGDSEVFRLRGIWDRIMRVHRVLDERQWIPHAFEPGVCRRSTTADGKHQSLTDINLNYGAYTQYP